MSADNWTECPKCSKEALDAHGAKLEAAQASYGNVSAKEYRKLILEAEKPYEPEITLREDYEIGIYNGKFRVSYRAHCSVCGFTYKYSFEADPVQQA